LANSFGAIPSITIGAAGSGLSSNVVLGQSGTSSPGLFANITALNAVDFNMSHEPHVKKYQVYEIENDLLALSVAWFRLRKQHANGGTYTPISKLLDSELLKHVSGEDIAQAQVIRDYYSKKIMVMKLKGTQLSRYKQDLSTFVHSDGKIFKEDMCPLVYRLPEFHEYDTQLDELYGTYNREITIKAEHSKNLKLVKSLTVGRKYNKRKEYWFSDEHSNLHRLSFTHDNPLLSLLDLYTKNELTISGRWRKTNKDDREFFINDKPVFS